MFEGWDVLALARAQFAFTMSFHIVFPAFSIGLASYLAVLEARWLLTAREVFLSLFNYWLKIFAVAFSMRQIALLVGVALSIALGIVIVLWARGPSYSLLYSQLGDRDAGDVVQALQTANIPYRLEGASIQVPASQVHDARLKLASQGLPHDDALHERRSRRRRTHR